MSAAHPTIQQIAVAAGWDLDDVHSIRQLQAHNWKDLDAHDLELVETRINQGSDEAMGRALGVRPSAAADRVDAAVLRVISPLAHEIFDWRARREDGESLELIAARAGTRELVVGLVLDGLPGRPRAELLEQQLAEAARRWRAGHDAEYVAAALDRSSEWLRRATRTGRLHLPPERLRRADLALHAGISMNTLAGAWSRRRVLPSPDGHDAIGSWWWRPTVEKWVENTLVYACHHCPARLPDQIGLRVHTTKIHREKV